MFKVKQVFDLGASLVAQLIKNPPAFQETLVRFLGQKNPLEKGKATHYSILELPLWLRWWRIHLQCERHLGLIPGSGRFPGGGHGNPLQYSCLENHHGPRSLAGYTHQLWVSFCIYHFCYLMYPHHYLYGNCIIYFWLFIYKVFLLTSLSSLLILGISLSTSFSFYSLVDILREFGYGLLSFIHESIDSTSTCWFPIAFFGHFAKVGGTVVNNIG